MAQVFKPRANTVARLIVFGGLPMLAGALGLGIAIARSPYVTGAQRPVEQPVPFSHQHHVGGLGIDCRYCHTSVEESSFAGVPWTGVCMTCHSRIWTNAEVLEPVRESYANGRPLRWKRVYDLPDFVYFDHSVHVTQGVGCVSCHGRVDRMPLTVQVRAMTMQWCLDCHREPERHLRPDEAIYDLDWRPGEDRLELGRRLVEVHGIELGQLTDCSVCHR